MSQVDQLISIARTQFWKPYVFGAEVNLNDPNPTSFDCCLTRDALIQLNPTLSSIADIQPGSMAYCWDNGELAKRRILGVSQPKVQAVFELKTTRRSIKASANHPFLTVAHLGRPKQLDGKFGTVNWSTCWKRLEDLARSDLIVTLRQLPNQGLSYALPDGTLTNETLMWFLGLFLADGHINNGSICLCVFGDKRTKAQRILRKLIGKEGTEHPTCGLYFSNKQLRTLIVDLQINKKSYDKEVPAFVWSLPHSQIRAFLHGYLTGDGSTGKRGYYEFKASSEKLIQQIRNLYMILGYNVSLVNKSERTRPIIIKGKTVKQAKPLYCFEVYPNSVKTNKHLRNDHGLHRLFPPDGPFAFERIKSIEPKGEEETFDLQIEGTHNFIANGLVVHNSEFIQWIIFQVTKIGWVDGASNQYNGCHKISLSQGVNTRGALLFHRYPRWHVEMSLGNGSSIGARGLAYGVCVSPGAATRFNLAGLIPIINYEEVDQLTDDDRKWILETIEKRDAVMAQLAQEFRTYNQQRADEIARLYTQVGQLLERADAPTAPTDMQAIAEDIRRRLEG